jgi:acetyl esterase/lipase
MNRLRVRFSLIAFALCCCQSTCLNAQSPVVRTVPLWPDGAPVEQGNSKIDQPSLTVYPVSGSAKVATGVIVCPGGGYSHLSVATEGTPIAAWLNAHGISAFVLRYRLGPAYHYPIQLWDVQRAIRYVRAHAADWALRPDQVGVWGFSAGGHLASTAGTHFDAGNGAAADPINRQSSRPDFMILAYPVITLEDPYTNAGSRLALIGEKPDPALIEFLSNERQVTKQTPPTFLFHTTEDAIVPVENSVFFYLALRKAGIPVEMHVYLKGPHGIGLAQSDPILRSWPEHLADWLRVRGLL